MPGSVKEIGLGKGVIAVDSEIDSVNYNPASLTGVNNFGVSIFYNNQLFGNNYIKSTIVHPLPKGYGSIGINFTMLNIPITEKFVEGHNEGSENLNDIGFNLAYQKDFFKNFSIGAVLKYGKIDLLDYSSSLFGIDIGLLYRIKGEFNIGLKLGNIGIGGKFKEERESLPSEINLGVMFNPAFMDYIKIYGGAGSLKGFGIKNYSLGAEVNILEALKFKKLGGNFKLDLIEIQVGYNNIVDRGVIGFGINIGLKLKNLNRIELGYGINFDVMTTHLIELKVMMPKLF
jgi:hypothetical protein